ncbi:MAG: O-antigen ligase family protein [Caldiserica bacterium]|nr:O-antigen ligase family protein [Caldisericota bacterium]
MTSRQIVFSLFFLLLLPLYLFPFIRPEILKSILSEAGILVVLFFVILAIFREKKLKIPDLPLLLLFLFSLVYFLVSALRGLPLGFHPEGWLPFFYLILSVSLILLPKYNHEKIIKYIVFIGIFVSLVAIYEKLVGFPGQWEYNFPQEAFSTLGNPNKLGAYMAVLFPLSLCLVKKKWQWVLPALILFALFLSRSEGAYISLIASALIWSFIYYPGKRHIIFPGLILLLLSLYFAFKSLPPQSVYWRFFHWEVGGRIFFSHPVIGTGLGGVLKNYAVFQAPIRPHFPLPPPFSLEKYLHNDFLQILSETGIIGFLLFYSPFILIMGNFFKREKSPDKFIAFSLITWFMLSMVSFPLYMPSVTLLVLIPLFLYLPGREIAVNLPAMPKPFYFRKGKGRSSNQNSAWLSKLSFIILLPLLLLSLFSLGRILIGEYHFRKGIFYLEEGRKSKGEDELQRSRRYNPRNPFLYYALSVLKQEEGEKEESLRLARKAHSLGLRHPRLQKLLQELEKD